MKPKLIIKIIVDTAMTVLLLLLMTYELIGGDVHELLGVAIFALFVTHHILNVCWTKSLFKGKYNAFKIFQTTLAVLVLAAMLCSMISGVILSRNVFTFLNIAGGKSFARNLHMMSAYWGFILISVHLGLHWSVFVVLAKKIFKPKSNTPKRVARSIALAISGYGVYAFIKRDIGTYMLLKSHFIFFDYEEPLILFLLDYIAVMGLFIAIGHYLSILARRIGRTEEVV